MLRKAQQWCTWWVGFFCLFVCLCPPLHFFTLGCVLFKSIVLGSEIKSVVALSSSRSRTFLAGNNTGKWRQSSLISASCQHIGSFAWRCMTTYTFIYNCIRLCGWRSFVLSCTEWGKSGAGWEGHSNLRCKKISVLESQSLLCKAIVTDSLTTFLCKLCIWEMRINLAKDVSRLLHQHNQFWRLCTT